MVLTSTSRSSYGRECSRPLEVPGAWSLGEIRVYYEAGVVVRWFRRVRTCNQFGNFCKPVGRNWAKVSWLSKNSLRGCFLVVSPVSGVNFPQICDPLDGGNPRRALQSRSLIIIAKFSSETC